MSVARKFLLCDEQSVGSRSLCSVYTAHFESVRVDFCLKAKTSDVTSLQQSSLPPSERSARFPFVAVVSRTVSLLDISLLVIILVSV